MEILSGKKRDGFPQASDHFAGRCGIGTLNERSLHACLKNYYEPDADKTEIRVGKFIADIVNEDGITEIQTRNFKGLGKKLIGLAGHQQVTVVYPVAQTKWIIWVDQETGETSKPRRSPKAGTVYDIFNELVFLSPMLAQTTGITFRIVLMELWEYRCLNGWSRDKKKGAAKLDLVPQRILGEIEVESPGGFSRFLPEGLPARFKVKDLQRLTGIPLRLAQRTLYVLAATGHIRKAGKDGRAYLYEREKADDQRSEIPDAGQPDKTQA